MVVELIVVCTTMERAKSTKNLWRRAGMNLNQVQFVSVRSLNSAEGLSGRVYVEADAIELARRLGYWHDLMVWAAGCQGTWGLLNA